MDRKAHIALTFSFVLMDPFSRFKKNSRWAVFWLGTRRLDRENISLASFQVLFTSGETPNDVRVTLLNQLNYESKHRFFLKGKQNIPQKRIHAYYIQDCHISIPANILILDQRCFNVISINVEITLIQRWKWNKIRRRTFNVAQRWYKVRSILEELQILLVPDKEYK